MTKQTQFLRVILLIVVLWLLFSAGLFLAERGADGLPNGVIRTLRG
jgi:hypothetical protein